MNKVLTYGLTKGENGLLKKQHTEFDFEDASDCFSDLLAFNCVAMIMNPEKLSRNEIEQLVEVYIHDPATLFIFINAVTMADIPRGISQRVCAVSDEAKIAQQLHYARELTKSI